MSLLINSHLANNASNFCVITPVMQLEATSYKHRSPKYLYKTLPTSSAAQKGPDNWDPTDIISIIK